MTTIPAPTITTSQSYLNIKGRRVSDEKKVIKNQIFSQHHEHTLEKFASFLLFNVVWFLILWTMMIGKLAASGFHEYFIHFTNWNWTMSAIFFLCDTISLLPLLVGWSRRNIISLYTVGGLFWVAHGMAWLVFWLVFIMFAENPGVLTNMAPKYDMGFLLDMDRLFHVLPAVFILLYALFCRRQIGWSLSILTYRGSFQSGVSSWIYLLGLVLMSSLLMIGIYFACFDIRHVYGMNTPIWILIPLGIVITIIFNGLVFVTIRLRYVK